MTEQLQALMLASAIVFCRVGGCFILLPGVGSARVPVQARLLLAIAISIAAVQLVLPHLQLPKLAGDATAVGVLAIGETAIGVAIGLSVRLFMVALQFSAAVIANVIGLTVQPQPGIDDQEPTTALSDLIVLTALTMMFTLGFHVSVFETVVGSYTALPAGRGIAPELALGVVVKAAQASFVLAAEIAAPFIIYSLVVNVLMAVANRWVPQIPVMFIATPIILGGALVVGHTSLPLLLEKFTREFARWTSGL